MDEDLFTLQSRVESWHRRHFPNVDTTWIVLKAVSEVGELTNARGKLLATGSADAIVAEMDAIGDVFVCLAALCAREGYDMASIIENTLTEIEGRSAERVRNGSQ